MQDVQPPRQASQDASPERLAKCSTERARKLVGLEASKAIGVLPLAVIQHNGATVLAGAVRVGEIFAVAQAIQFRFGLRARLVEVESKVLDEAITISFKGDGVALEAAVNRIAECKQPQSVQVEREIGKLLWMPTDAGAAQVFAELVEHALARSASDITMTPRESGCEIRLKIDGDTHRWNGKKISNAFHQQIIRRAKVLSRMDPTITTIPQDGSFEGANGLRARISTLPSIHGENLVVRLVSSRVRTLDTLGLSAPTRERIERWLGANSGVIVFGGPTGSGKSASLYACMRELVERGLGVASIEDPVEQEVLGAVQSEVAIGGTFSTLVRAVLRQAPDVIAVGEVRDSETAIALVEAATTGHLVLCSVHGGSIRQILERFRRFGIDDSTLAIVLRGVVVQRLLPRLCAKCRVVDLALGGYREVGCVACQQSGYDGRVLVTESLEHSKAGSDAIVCEPPYFLSWNESLAQLVKDGIVSQRLAALVMW